MFPSLFCSPLFTLLLEDSAYQDCPSHPFCHPTLFSKPWLIIPDPTERRIYLNHKCENVPTPWLLKNLQEFPPPLRQGLRFFPKVERSFVVKVTVAYTRLSSLDCSSSTLCSDLLDAKCSLSFLKIFAYAVSSAYTLKNNFPHKALSWNLVGGLWQISFSKDGHNIFPATCFSTMQSWQFSL